MMPIGQARVSSDLLTEFAAGSVDVLPPPHLLATLRELLPSLRHLRVSQQVLAVSVLMTTGVQTRGGGEGEDGATSEEAGEARGEPSKWVSRLKATLQPAAPTVDLMSLTHPTKGRPALPVGFALEGVDAITGAKGSFWPRKEAITGGTDGKAAHVPSGAAVSSSSLPSSANKVTLERSFETDTFLEQLLSALLDTSGYEGSLDFDKMRASAS